MNNHTNQTESLQNWVELSISAVEHNAAQFAQWLGPDTAIAAVIKSNAYGHGLVEMAKLYDQCKNITALCTINATEAITLRQHGIAKPIFVIGYLDVDYNLIAQHNLQVVVYDFATAQKLNVAGQKNKTIISVHIKFDSGMSRLGVTPAELDQFIDQLKTLPWITITGIFSHLAQGYDEQRTDEQEQTFAATEKLNLATHLANSHGSLNLQKKYNFARIGIGLYGYLQRQSPEKQALLKPVLSLKTRILQIKSVIAGTLIGYDGMFCAPTDMTIAIIAIGYHEGVDARLSNCGFVIINGKLAPIVGRVCMNLTIVDISQISGCNTGQIVTVLGNEGDLSISAYDWSTITKASVYNHLTKLSSSLPKIIVQ